MVGRPIIYTRVSSHEPSYYSQPSDQAGADMGCSVWHFHQIKLLSDTMKVMVAMVTRDFLPQWAAPGVSGMRFLEFGKETVRKFLFYFVWEGKGRKKCIFGVVRKGKEREGKKDVF